MATVSQKEAIRQWKELCATIQNMTSVPTIDTEVNKMQRIKRARTDYAFFVQYYFPHYCTDQVTGMVTPSAKFHIDTANRIKREKNIRAVLKWARGHAKSTNIDVTIPMWLKCQETPEFHFMVLVGKSEEAAMTLLGALQAEFQYNQRYIRDFGRQVNMGTWKEGSFVTSDDCAFFALGRGQSPRGLRHRSYRPDYIVIDDLDDDELCQNEERVRKTTEWVTDALFGAFGASGGRFIMVGNLISKCSVLELISKKQSVYVSQVNIYDKNGNPSWPELWTRERIEERATFMGYRAFQKEYMNNPITEGAVFRHNWIRYKRILPLREYEDIVLYVDPSFKPTTKNDYKAAKLWGKTKSGELHLIKAFCRQTTVVEMVRWLYDLYEWINSKNAVASFYMEANFMQDIILDEFRAEGKIRGYQLPILPDKRKKPDKFQRIVAISPLWERGFVFYNETLKNDPDMIAGLEQTLAFEKGMSGHDDSPDADEGAIYKLQQRTRQSEWEPSIGTVKNSKYIW